MAQSDMVMMVVEDGRIELQEMFTKQKEQDLVLVGLLVMLVGRRGSGVASVSVWWSLLDGVVKWTRQELELRLTASAWSLVLDKMTLEFLWCDM